MVTKSWALTTSAFDRSIQWPVDHVCSAKADAPHPHSELPVGVQTTGVSGSFQTEQCTLGQPEQGI